MQITIKDKQYGLHWGFGAVLIASEVLEKDADSIFFNSIFFSLDDKGELDLNKPVSVSSDILFGAITNWCLDNEVSQDFTYHQFINAFNEFDENFQEIIAKDYYASKYKGKVVESIFNEMIAKSTDDNSAKEPVKKKKVTSSK